MAGSMPVAGAAVQVYSAGTTGNGSAATALLAAPITTDASGAFTVPASYSCPAAGSQLYVIVRGGSVGAAAANDAIELATAIGICNQLKASSQFVINEVTTAATAWALGPFFTTGVNLGASATNTQGLSNAVATVANLANLSTGTSPGTTFPANGVSPAGKINSLANLLNTCTAAATAAPCDALFSAATPTGDAAPTNTFDATLNVVHNPGGNVAALYAQSMTASAFTPALATAPADWTLFVTYTGGGMSSPAGLAVDSGGNVWVASFSGGVTEFSSTGMPLFANGITAGGLYHSFGIAIDAENNVWVANRDSPTSVNTGHGSVTVLNPSGQVTSGMTGYTAGGVSYPLGVAIDPNTDVWVVDYGDAHVTLLSDSGTPLSGAEGYTTDSIDFPVSIAVDANHNAWIGDQNDANVTRVSSDGTQFVTVSCCRGPVGLAIDAAGDVWVANYYGNDVTALSSSGTVLLSGATGGGLEHPQGIAIDGGGSVWVANYRGPALTELAGSTASTPGQVLSPAVGWAPDAALFEAYALAIDQSGNIWVTNYGNDSITEFVGVAKPVKTPLIGPVRVP